MRKNKYIIILLLSTLCLFSCSEDWMKDVVPSDQKDANEDIKNLAEAENALNGVFSYMQKPALQGGQLIAYGDLKGMDVRSTEPSARGFQKYAFQETTEASSSGFFTAPYTVIASVNKAIPSIENLKSKNDSDKERKNEILGNLYLIRAFQHFNLLKLYARIPTTVDNPDVELGVVIADRLIERDEMPKRSTLTESYNSVIADMKKAVNLMPKDAHTEGWFTKSAMQALLAKVYLFNGNNQESYDLCKSVVDNSGCSLMQYDKYLKSWASDQSNSETLWEVVNTDDDNPSREGIGYLWSQTGYKTMSVTKSFIDILNEEPNDIRLKLIEKVGEVGKEAYICGKYPGDLVNKIRVLRLAEVYFIEAEVAFKLGKVEEARKLVNTVIEARTKIADKLSSSDVTIERIILEKRKEFVGEGKAFFDLMRNKISIKRGKEDLVLPAPDEIKYNDYRTIQPIPRIELNVNTNIQQNPEYAK